MVYAALNTALNRFEDPEEQLKDWRELGSFAFAHVLVISVSPDWASYPGAFGVDPWIAEHLRPYSASQLVHLVDQWLNKHPLPLRVSVNPEDEDAKVRRLRELRVGPNSQTSTYP